MANTWMAWTGHRAHDGELPDGPTNRGRLNRSPEPMKTVGLTFVIYRDLKKEYRWRLIARNKKILGDSGEGYKRKSQVVKMIGKIIMGPHRIIE